MPKGLFITFPLGISAIHENAEADLSFTAAVLQNDLEFIKQKL